MARLAVVRSIRHFCRECQGGSSRAVRECADTECALWEWRLPPEHASEASADSLEKPADSLEVAEVAPAEEISLAIGEISARSRCALRSIRRHCLACAGERADVRTCRSGERCVLWQYRFGVRPETYKTVRQRFLAPRQLSLFTTTD